MKTCTGLLLTLLATALLPVRAAKAPAPHEVRISRAAAQALLDGERAMNPASTASFRKLDRAFPRRNDFSVAEVLAIRDGYPAEPPTPPLVLGRQTGPPPPGAWPRARVAKRYEALEKIDPENTGLMKRLDERVGKHAEWFTTEQVISAETVPEFPEWTAEEAAAYTAQVQAAKVVVQAEHQERQGWQWPRIRRDWRDVIFDEDPSLDDQGKALSDLEGALFSFVHDGLTDAETWNAHGAIMVPFTYEPIRKRKAAGEGQAWLWRFALAPSLTYDRVTTNGDPKDEVDSLFYRVGVFLDLYRQHQPKATAGQPEGEGGPQTIFGYGLQVRAAGVQVTDHGHRAGLSGFEVDVEPRFHYGEKVGLGYQANLWRKETPERADGSDTSYLLAQLRLWLHLEGGDVQDVGEDWEIVEKSFLRLGPTVQLQLEAPLLPGGRTASLTALYSHLSALSGPTTRPSYFRATLAYDLFREAGRHRKVGLAASYEQGGLNFTKEKVDTFTLGLSVLF